ncbi:MAG: ferritin-like domain-containing protein [Myxococcota bacterium]
MRRWMTALAGLLALFALLASSAWAYWEWSLDVESFLSPDEKSAPERLVVLTVLQVPAFGALLLVFFDGIRQRRDAMDAQEAGTDAGPTLSLATAATGLFTLTVSVVVLAQSAYVWLFEPYHQVVIGRPLPGTPLPTDTDRWAWDARMEHQAVAAFEELARDLTAHGAPTELVHACLDAAAEEAGHARDSAALAGISLGPVARSARPTPGRARMAWESIRHGVVGEGRAVAHARHRLRGPLAPAERRLLERIAVEERSHAVLSARIAAWALFAR